MITNPFGVLYNPASIFQCLHFLIQGEFPYEEALFEHDSLWSSWYHSSAFSAVSRSQCVDNIDRDFRVSSKTIPHLQVLFITLGTNHCYVLKDKGMVVSNCHKCPSALFEERILDVPQITEQGREVLEELFGINPNVRIVFTISPFRYQKYGFHGNQLAKAALMLSVHHLQEMFPAHVSYFPAYEIVHDELRDYRYYAEDMLHVSSFTEEYIWEKVCGTFLSETALTMIDRWRSISEKMCHRPLNTESPQYRMFLKGLLSEIRTFQKLYPHNSVEEELDLIQSRTNKLDTK